MAVNYCIDEIKIKNFANTTQIICVCESFI